MTYTYDAANRLYTDSASHTWTYDADGRLTVRPGDGTRPDEDLVFDDTGRLTRVDDASTSATLATYTYDALDRLLVVDHGSGDVTRYRYVGTTTAIAEVVDDTTGSVIRSVGNDWGGNRLLDWTGTGSNQRFYGSNAHHDVTWLADDTGAVTATLRYDPFGGLTATTGSSLPDTRFQGSLYDPTTELSWVISRWYAPELGTFISEDSLLGSPEDPPSRHLYAYAQGDPIDGWDPDGRFWYSVRRGDTLWRLAARFLGNGSKYKRIYNWNRERIKSPSLIRVGQCIWIPRHGQNRGCRLKGQLPDTSTDPSPQPGPAPDICQKHPDQCPPPPPPQPDPFLQGIKNLRTAGICQANKYGIFPVYVAFSICALKDIDGHRALTFTPGLGVEIGITGTSGVSYTISNGASVKDQYGWFETTGGDVGLAGTISFSFAKGSGTRGQEVRNVDFAVGGGAALAVRHGWTFTTLYDSQSDINNAVQFFGFDPWFSSDLVFNSRYWWLQHIKDASCGC